MNVPAGTPALPESPSKWQLTLTGLGIRGATRRRKRSLATMALLACGSFIVVAVGANRLDANRNAWERSSGTGGFAFIGESSLPIVHDLNAADGRDFYGLNAQDLEGVAFVPMRVREGDDASCLNLNRAQTPRLLGVNPELLQQRKAFSFQKVASGYAADQGWLLLDKTEGADVVPAIGDYNSILWAMGKKVGDTLDYVDERGRPFKVKLVGAVANSILQGNLLISERNLVQRFPGVGGHRMFLVDAPSNTVTQTAAVLMRGLQDTGLELTPAAERLDAFNAVQNTYLNTFQVLGGLGLLVGSAGLGVVVLRNVLERRGELALLQAVGFRRRSLRWLILSEHSGLLLGGLAIGLVAAVIAIVPTFSTATARLPALSLGLTIGSVLVTGLIWTWLAVAIALRGELLNALRNE
jgi:putative ABC transport system permease protein